MVESNVTRRRVLQGAGAIGVASLGSTVISAQEGDGGGGGDQGAAIRVAHASPDAPNVDVRLTSQDGGAAAGGGNETGGDANATGNETGGGQDGGDAPSIEGVSFRDVSGYNELDPGSYQVEIVPAEGGLLEGFVDDLFGGGDGGDEETVLFEDQIDVEEGTTYTVVAFGEVAQGPVPAEGAEVDGAGAGQNETDGGLGGNETGGVGENETGTGMDANESDGGVASQNETGGTGQNETDGAGAGGAAGQEDQLVSELGFGESETVEVDAGDHSIEVREAGAAGTTGGTDDGTAGNETGAGAGQNETGAEMDANETDGGVAGENETGGAGAGDTAGQTGGSDRGFQVSVLEDDVSDPGEGTARVRVFHAVPDVDTVSISRISDGGAGQGGAGGNETGGAGAGQNETGGAGAGGNDTDGIGGDEGAGQQDGEGGAGGDGPGQDDGVGAGQGDGAGQGENGTGATNGAVQQQEGVRQAQVSTDANTVYSGFAVGYFDPQAAATAGDQGGDGGAGQEGGDGAGAAQNESDEGIGAGQQGDDGNATGNETGGEGEQIAEDAEGEEFEFVTVEDAQGGERSDGGTGGLLDLAAVADD